MTRGVKLVVLSKSLEVQEDECYSKDKHEENLNTKEWQNRFQGRPEQLIVDCSHLKEPEPLEKVKPREEN